MIVNTCVVNADSVQDLLGVKQGGIKLQINLINMHSFVICEALMNNLNISESPD